MPADATVSIIIPTLNEAAMLGVTLAGSHVGGALHEVIVVDGGSTDGTPDIAAGTGAKVIRSPRAQRVAQMNLGAQSAAGDTLLFLHADTHLPSGSIANVAAALRDERVGGGAFARRYASGSLFLRATCLLAEWRGIAFGWHLGDQAMFVRRALFEQLGGFADMDIFEDLDFSRRLRRVSRTLTLRPPVISHARRFETLGPAATTWRDLLLTLRYLRQGPERRVVSLSTARTP